MRKKILNILAWGCVLFVVFKIYLQLFHFLVGYVEKQAQMYIKCKFSLLEQRGKLNSIIKLRKGEGINCRFISLNNNLQGITIETVTWGNKQQKYLCTWVLKEISGVSFKTINSGVFYSIDAIDWSYLKIDFGKVTQSKGKIYELNITSDIELKSNFIGIPLFEKPAENKKLELMKEVNGNKAILPSYQFLFQRQTI